VRKILILLSFFLATVVIANAAPKLTIDPAGNWYQYWLTTSSTPEGKTLHLARSLDQGITFGPARKIYFFSAEVEACNLKVGLNLTYSLAFETSRESYFTVFTGQNKISPLPVKISGEAVSSPVLGVDSFGRAHLLYLSEDKNRGLKKLNYATAISLSSLEATLEARVLFETADEIANPKISFSLWGPLLSWQKKYLNRSETYLTASLDGGKHFTTPQILFLESDLWEISFLGAQQLLGREWLFIAPPSTSESRPVLKAINFSPPQAPEVLHPKAKFATNVPSLEISYRPSRTEPLIVKIEICPDKNFPADKTYSFEHFYQTNSGEAKYRLPLELPEGNYYLRLSSFNGLASSLPGGTTEFTIDQTPQLKILKPKETDWFKPDSTIFIEARMLHPPEEIEDEKEGEVVLNEKVLPDKLTYNQSENKIAGFITLPPELAEGKVSARLRLSDRRGRIGEKSFTINIDRQPPALILNESGAAFSNSGNSITIPLQDTGSGIDKMGTRITMAGISFEVAATSETGLTLKTRSALVEGSYEVSVTPRDLVGNTGGATAFSLIVDTTLPKLVLSSIEAQTEQTKIVVAGAAEDDYLSAIKIYLNQKLVESFFPREKVFSKEISLFPGSNEILVEVLDQAGNRGMRSLKTFANFRSQSSLVTKHGNAPNPFSPKKDGQMYFTYNFSTPVTLKIYIFDLTGTLIWQRQINNAVSDGTPWNGIDHFGESVASGVYPYSLQASSGGTVEIRRGKIVLLQ
jgi:hypothetical protein